MKNDSWYYDLCCTVAKNSKCLSRKIGAIIVRDKLIIATGMNGPPRGVPHCSERYDDREFCNAIYPAEPDPTKCPRQVMGFKSGEGLEWCIAGHAERNALINAARHGVATKGAKMYMNCPTPCTPCLIEIINAGIEEIIITKELYYDKMAKWVLDNSNLKWRLFNADTRH